MRLMRDNGTFGEYLRLRTEHVDLGAPLLGVAKRIRDAHACHGMHIRDVLSLAKSRVPAVMLEVGDDMALVPQWARAAYLAEGWVSRGMLPESPDVFEVLERPKKSGRERVKITFGEF